jgi:hypothetical protein
MLSRMSDSNCWLDNSNTRLTRRLWRVAVEPQVIIGFGLKKNQHLLIYYSDNQDEYPIQQ